MAGIGMARDKGGPEPGRSKALTAAGEPPEALSARLAEAGRAVAADPGAEAPLIALATLLRQSNRAPAAVRLLSRALSRAPDRVTLWNHLGLALRAANRPRAALAAFRRAARLDPANPWAETNMAFGLLREPGTPARATFAGLSPPGAAAEIGLGLFCDRFPHTYGFLIQQYSTYLERFPDARVYSFGRRVLEPYHPGQFAEGLAGYRVSHPGLAGRVHQLVPELEPADPGTCTRVGLRVAGGGFRRPRLGHTVFAMNADLFRPLFETLEIPFSITLNPGGGFRLDQPYSDERLRRVFGSPWFRHVIVTYPLTRDYVRSRFGVPDDRMTLIPGTIVLERLLEAHRRPKRYYGRDKDTLDLCFAGIRYSATGADKGYDRFLAAGRRLLDRFPALRLHVVGNFAPDTLDVTDLAGRITFYGRRDQRWMAGFFPDMDAIISPNVADHLALGAFDGFPVTTCLEAGMVGVALFATDPMGLNQSLVDGEHFVAIPPDPAGIVQRLEAWLADPDRLYRLAAAGERRIHDVWGETAQMEPRVALMKTLIGQAHG
jgi:glycosyltransferase involved in cell wall biosynthesis